MKIPFSKQEVVSMVENALEEGWNPLKQIEEVTFHSLQSEAAMTLHLKGGVQVKLSTEAIEEAIVVAFNTGVAPVKVEKPKVTEISFHNSAESFAKVSVESEEVQSRFGSDDE